MPKSEPSSGPSQSNPPAATKSAGPNNPVTLGKYRLVDKLGSGGMGAVFKAEDTELNRIVAVKILPKDKAKNPTLVKRFKAEAQAAANLSHDNIVQIYGAGEFDGYLYISLELIEGTDVQELVSKHGVLPVKRSLDIIRQMGRALEHTGSMNLAHRDIKPSNLLIQPDGLVKLTDLGLARFIDEETETGITRAGYTVGTVDYMAPEQARDSKSADVRSDIYSLGCTWYFMLTGQPPFPEGSVTNKIAAHALNPVPDPRTLNPNIPESVVVVLNRMLAKEPADRYQTGRELLADLKTLAQSRDQGGSRVRDLMRDDSPVAARSSRSRTGSESRRSQGRAGSGVRERGSGSRKRSRNGTRDSAPKSGGIQIQIDPMRFVFAALTLIGVIAGVVFLGSRLSSVATEPLSESQSPDSNSNPSAPIIKPRP